MNELKALLNMTEKAQQTCNLAEQSLKISYILPDVPIDKEEMKQLIKVFHNVSLVLEVYIQMLKNGGIFSARVKNVPGGPGQSRVCNIDTAQSICEWQIRSDLLQFMLDDGADMETAIDSISNMTIDGCLKILYENGIYDEE